MKALVLAAGKGTRLRPLTNTVPKHLLPVGDSPILFRVLDYIMDAGIEEIGIVVSPDLGLFIEEALCDWQRPRARVTLILQAEPKGLAHAVKVAQGFLGESPFLMLLGDNLVQDGVTGFLDDFRASNYDASVVLKEVDDPRAFGVAEVDSSGKVTRMVEKPKEPKSNLAIIGVYLFTSEIHRAIDQIRPSWRGELEITDAIQKLLEMGRQIRSHLLKGWWLDIGSNEGLLKANHVILDASAETDIRGKVDLQSSLAGPVQIGEQAELENSRVEGPALIGAGCRITNSIIKPFTNIRAGTTIQDSSIEGSLILENCRISGIVSLTDSIIGRNSTLTGQKESRRVVRLYLGDDCEVDLS
ncbi:MAG: glucose-1-phosphate thymidylyltransferase [Dehalococcoidia bacterium]